MILSACNKGENPPGSSKTEKPKIALVMKSLANETGGIAYFIKNTKQLSETYKLLEKELRSQYLLSYHAEASTKDQAYRTIEVKVDRPNAKVRTIRGYIP